MITDYASLKTAVADWLARGDLTAKIPDFIALAGSRIARNLRTRSVVASLTLDSTGIITLPTDLAELRYLRLNNGNYNFPVEITSPVAVADTLDRWGSAGGVPARGAVMEGKLYLAPHPDQSYTAEITYFQKLPALSDSITTNFALDAAPDLYLAGAMIEAFLFLDYDERLSAWESKFTAAIDELEQARERAEFSAAPAPVRLPVVFE